MKLLAIIEHTLREGLARKTIIGFFVISSFFLVVAVLTAIFIPSTLELGNPQTGQETIDLMNNQEVIRQVQALLAGFINFAALLLSIFATASIIPNTLEKGSIDLLLSKPVSRNEILFGKFIGSLLIVILNVGYYIIGMWLIFGVRTGFWNTGFLAVTLSITFTFLVLYAPMMVIGISSRSSALTIIILYVFLFLISPILETREIIAQVASNDTVKHILDVLYYPLPKPDALGLVSRSLVMGETFDWMPIWTSALFALAMYVLAVFLFRKKDF
ncbi:MAG: ABC transporter permease subunit [Bacteroidetes bacterium]|nr:ABC transporter permease subunit [Bacteroidota bacterium]